MCKTEQNQQGLTGGKGMSGTPCDVTAVVEAAKRSEGPYEIPSDQIEIFLALLEKGGQHVTVNAPREGGFKNQIKLDTNNGARPLFFNIFTPQPIKPSTG